MKRLDSIKARCERAKAEGERTMIARQTDLRDLVECVTVALDEFEQINILHASESTTQTCCEMNDIAVAALARITAILDGGISE